MKKLSILLLALAFVAVLALPAMAGDLSVDGEYTFGAEQHSNDVDYGLWYDEFDVNVDLSMGDVAAHWELVLYDDSYFDRSDPGTSLVDLTKVTWSVNDALAIELGDYGIAWGNDILLDDAMKGTGTIGVMYSLDVADLALYLSRDEEGAAQDPPIEDDATTMGASAQGTIGPVEGGVIVLQTTNDITDNTDHGLVGAYGNFTVGPVQVALEYGSISADDNAADADSVLIGDGGTILLAEFGLGDIVGFDFNVGLVQTNEDFTVTGYSNDFDRAKIYDAEESDQQMVYVNAEYGVNDNAAVGVKAIVSNDVGGDDGPTEVDGYATYSFADNISLEAGYGSMTGNDTAEDETLGWYEFVFDF